MHHVAKALASSLLRLGRDDRVRTRPFRVGAALVADARAILTTVAFAAAYDLYLRESSRKDLWQVLPIMQKLRVYVILFLYFLALLSSQ